MGSRFSSVKLEWWQTYLSILYFKYVLITTLSPRKHQIEGKIWALELVKPVFKNQIFYLLG